MSVITVLEDTLLARISDAFPDGHVRTVEALPGRLNQNVLKRLVKRMPAVLVSWLGNVEARQRPEQFMESRWAIYCATAHASGRAARQRGDAVAIGAYEMIPSVAHTLITQSFDGYGRARLRNIDNLWSGQLDDQGVALYALTLAIPMAFESTTSLNELHDFITFDNESDINGDSVVDQHTEITLEQD